MEPIDTKNCTPRTSSLCSRGSSPILADSASTYPSQPPRTVILGLWSYAPNEQIQTYLDGYRTLYPSTRLITLLPSRSRASVTSQLDGALGGLTTTADKLDDGGDTTLLHLFGNDGAFLTCGLLRAYRARAARPLSIKAMVFDRIPPTIAPSVQTMRSTPEAALTFAYATLMAHISCLWIALPFWDFETKVTVVRSNLNNPDLVPQSARKCYVFSDSDCMFRWKAPDGREGDESEGEVEGEVAGERRELCVMRHSIDRRGRWTGDRERYWLGIEGVWDGR